MGAIGAVSERAHCNRSAEATAACEIRATARSSMGEQKRKRGFASGSRRNQGAGAREECGIDRKKWRWCAEAGSRDASGVREVFDDTTVDLMDAASTVAAFTVVTPDKKMPALPPCGGRG